VSFISSRIRRLERRAREARCVECGLPPDGLGRIVLERLPEGEPEFCPECVRPLWTVIKVVYDGDEEGGGE
jgi:hypothetical protein